MTTKNFNLDLDREERMHIGEYLLERINDYMGISAKSESRLSLMWMRSYSLRKEYRSIILSARRRRLIICWRD